MPRFDLRCTACGHTFEDDLITAKDKVPCLRCAGEAGIVWLKAPGMVPDVWNPYYDIQLGKTITSRAQKSQLLKERGLIEMGQQEMSRTDSQSHEPPDNWDSAGFHDAAAKAWNDVKYGNVPKVEEAEVPTTPTGVLGVDA